MAAAHSPIQMLLANVMTMKCHHIKGGQYLHTRSVTDLERVNKYFIGRVNKIKQKTKSLYIAIKLFCCATKLYKFSYGHLPELGMTTASSIKAVHTNEYIYSKRR
jgi:hypothetical protein